MAAVSVQLSPHVLQSMASRRAPLTNISNAGNSPLRSNAASLKRARAQLNVVQASENAARQPPPKRQALEPEPAGPVTPRKAQAEQRGSPLTPARRQHAPRTREPTRPPKQENPAESMEKLRQWQKHNEKTFPTYVFFFENVPESARRECLRGVKALGSREAPFFSKDVTHVITTRAIPAEGEPKVSTGSLVTFQQQEKIPLKTIDPSVLEKDRSLDTLASIPKTRFTFEARKPLAPAPDAENRHTQPSDTLLRAKNMGMKIWGLDKLKRILDVMFEDTTSSNTANARSKFVNTSTKTLTARPHDLQQLISNEQLNGPTDREAKGVYNEIVSFKGPYLYVRCCYERVKPIMVREWSRVTNREDGEWPQFRSVSSGKCPFVEEDRRARKPAPKGGDRTKARCAQTTQKEVAATKPSKVSERAGMQPPMLVGRKRPLSEIENTSTGPLVQQLPPQPSEHADTSRPGTSQGAAFPARSGLLGGEPMASGMQGSAVTSAIRSQAISSTAAAPGAKAGTSREMHGLQRKMLARAHGSTQPARARPVAIAGPPAAASNESRSTKQRPHERTGMSRLAQVLEGPTEEDDEPETEHADAKDRVSTCVPARRKTVVVREKRDLKPGFCENCREKFDDFEEHTISKRHRKFAATEENWADLDDLLLQLGRPQLRNAPISQ